MNLCRCPVCHSNIHIDALIQDKAGSELLRLATKEALYGCGWPLVEYVALFRPAKSSLSNVRALSLAKEVLEKFKPSLHLRHALAETVRNIKESRASGTYTALTNHSYLTKVYESSKALFPYSVSRTKDNPVVDSEQTKDAYFRQMQSFGQDITKLPGGAEWLTKQGVQK